jgi:hypothetical protein
MWKQSKEHIVRYPKFILILFFMDLKCISF